MAIIKEYKTILKNNLEITIRSAQKKDALLVMNIGKHLMEDGEGQVIEADEFTFDECHEANWIQQHHDNHSDVLILVEANKIIIGILNFEAKPRRRISHTGEFGMGLHRDYRGMGIGKILMIKFIEWARSNSQIEKLNLRVLEDNIKAISIYKKLGFKEDGRKTNEIKLEDGSYLDDISMELLL